MTNNTTAPSPITVAKTTAKLSDRAREIAKQFGIDAHVAQQALDDGKIR